MSEGTFAGRRHSASGSIRVLGLDPASAGPTGFGIVESDGRQRRMVHYGALKVSAKRQKECASAVLQEVHVRVCGLLEEFAPDFVAVESVFTALNMRTALRLAEVRGVILLAAAQHAVEVFSYAPREVKACVAGHGQADKRQMQTMVRALLSMKELPEPSDAADALAVALCHLQREEVRRRFGVPQTQGALGSRNLRVTTVPGSRQTEIRNVGATRGGSPRIVSTR